MGNLFPVIMHLVILCSAILHLLHQLFAACADRWLLLFDIHSPPVRSASHSLTPPKLNKTLRYGPRWITLTAEKASWSQRDAVGPLRNITVYSPMSLWEIMI